MYHTYTFIYINLWMALKVFELVERKINKCICVQKFRFHSPLRPDERPCRLAVPLFSATGNTFILAHRLMSADGPIVLLRQTNVHVRSPACHLSSQDESLCWLADSSSFATRCAGSPSSTDRQIVHSSLCLLWDWWCQDPANTEDRHDFGMSLKMIAKTCIQKKNPPKTPHVQSCITHLFLVLDINPCYQHHRLVA